MTTNSEGIEVTFIDPETIEAVARTTTVETDKQHVKITARGVAVDKNYFWIPLDDSTPRGTKIQLFSRYKSGLPQYGQWDGKYDFFTHWAPIPSLAPDEVQ